jgi:hypothetical protein
MERTEDPRLTLEAGSFERFCIIREDLNLYKHTVVAASYSRPSASSEPISRDAVFKALKQCIVQHHALCTVVHNADTEAPQLIQAFRMDLNVHVHTMDVVDDGDTAIIKPFLLAAHNLPMSEKHPAWRVALLPIRSEMAEKFLVAFVCSHALLDGRSAFVFHSTFLQALRNVAMLPFDSTPVFEPPLSYNIPPELNDGGRLSVSRGYLKAALEAKARQDQKSPVEEDPFWTGSSLRRDVSAETVPPPCLELVVIPNTTISKAIEVCRLHGTRLTGLLTHLAARSILRALRKRGQSYSKLLAFTLLDLRKLLQQPLNTMANLVTSVNEQIEIDVDSLNDHQTLRSGEWDNIRTTTDLLRERSMASGDQPVALLGYLSSYRDYLLHLASTPPKESFAMSNLGSIDGGADAADQSSWIIDDVTFSQSCYAAGAALLFNVASSKNGALNMTVTWWPGMLGVGCEADEHAFVQDVTADISIQLDAVGRQV